MNTRMENEGTIAFGKLVRFLECPKQKMKLPFQPEIITIKCTEFQSVMRGKMPKRGGS